MEKIRVVHHSNQIGLGGTEKTMQLFCKYLDKNIFDVYALSYKYPIAPQKVWLNNFKALLGNKTAKGRKLQFEQYSSRVPAFKELLGQDHFFLSNKKELPMVLKKISPHILHLHHSGEIEVPLDQVGLLSTIPIIFSTNVFGLQGRYGIQERITKILFVSHWLKEMSAAWSEGDSRCDVLYNPVESPMTEADLRAELNISRDTLIIGRIGRNADDIHDPISLRAYKQIEKKGTLFLVLSPPMRMVREAQELGIKNIRYLQPTTNELFLNKFYNTLDILAHARSDGETFGCVIAEAMIHGKPVVTHYSDIRNAQAELVDKDCGFVASQHNDKEYASFLRSLMENKSLRLRMGEAARRKALESFEAKTVTNRLERLYIEELNRVGYQISA